MLRVLSREEELEGRREAFAKLKPGSLFDLGQERFFIAVKKIDEKLWEVIELTETNKKKIISGQPSRTEGVAGIHRRKEGSENKSAREG